MSNYTWDSTFTELFERCLVKYKSGDTDFTGYYSEADSAFLKSIGYSSVEFFDFVEDFARGGDPTLAKAILIASVRRDYLDVVMKGELSDHQISPDDLPAKTDEVEGFVWLPRIMAKARAKLRGELHPDMMFCCGGDRKFLSTHGIAPSDFLRVVWAAGDDDGKIINYVKTASTIQQG